MTSKHVPLIFAISMTFRMTFRQQVTYVSNRGYGRAGLGLSLDIVGQGREQGGEQSHPDPQGGGSQG